MRMFLRGVLCAGMTMGAAFVVSAEEIVGLNAGWSRTVGSETRMVDLPDDFRINLPWAADAGGGQRT